MLQGKRFVVTLAALLTLNAALWLVTAGFALPRSMVNYFLGPKMIRSEIVVKDGNGLHDFRLDQGKIRSIDRVNMAVTLKERDGQVVQIPVATDASVRVNGKPARFGALRVGWQTLVIRDSASGEKANQIWATKPPKSR